MVILLDPRLLNGLAGDIKKSFSEYTKGHVGIFFLSLADLEDLLFTQDTLLDENLTDLNRIF